MTQLLLSASEDFNELDPTIVDFLHTEKILETLCHYTKKCYSKRENVDHMFETQLDLYEFLTTSSNQKLLYHKQIIEPLLQFVTLCSIRIDLNDTSCENLDLKFISILHQLCIGITVHTEILNLLFTSSQNESESDRFPVFNLLIPYVHREGYIGQQARDALLLIMSLSTKYQQIAYFVANQSNFCPVLATGLSGLYSSLPCKLEYPSDDWHHISDDDLATMPELKMFVNSLEFCNAVIQVSHSSICSKLLEFVVNGFLLPVVGPALNQSTIEEVTAATAYLDLFIRKITEPSLLKVFIDFLLKGKVDEVSIMDLLITRISSQLTRLCVVTLTLFKSLIDLNCEDVMFHLVYKYLLPCKHIMLSQHRVIKQIDYHNNDAKKFLSLMPQCFVNTPAPPKTTTQTTTTTSTTLLDSISKHSSEDAFSIHSASTDYNDEINNSFDPLNNTNNNSNTPTQSFLPKSTKFAKLSLKNKGYLGMLTNSPMKINTSRLTAETPPRTPKSSLNTSQQPATAPLSSSTTTPPTATSTTATTTSIEDYSSYSHYLRYAHFTVLNCKEACSRWSLKYDGCHLFNDVSSRDKSNEEDQLNKTLKNDVIASSSSSTTTTTSAAAAAKSYSKYYHICGDITDSNSNEDEKEADARDKSQTASTNPVDQDQNASGDHEDLYEFLQKLNEIALPSECLKSSSEIMREMDELFLKYNVDVGSDSLGKQSLVADDVVNESGIINGVNITHLYKLCSSLPDKPLIGPFLESLMDRVDRMMHSTLYVNLHLTSILSRLACYPHPLLTSFLLNQNLVFQPSVKSLYQVLNSVRLRLDDYIGKQKDRDILLAQAHQFLVCRVNQDQMASSTNDAGKRKSFDLFRSNQAVTPLNKRLFSNANNNSAYFKRRTSNNQNADDTKESIEKRNAVYAVVIFKEFIKELAAIAQEQTVIQLSSLSSPSSSSPSSSLLSPSTTSPPSQTLSPVIPSPSS
ncbi:hypothetical protein HELRODRAFT_94403 [Helobdella robusta]|uniref:FHF complex subunit HOOK-interacting protein C-terminal domain-containing protein n=1 Tax=Helobdella robusta TaxID=6412 RepID=T1G908_HELRO|nr:hypothetical protein HELRODRAFT_94403 [Helobdella robusta]ESO02133.1 hypothetical protein HELRODRAFT_94403 [Helobdella robusta]